MADFISIGIAGHTGHGKTTLVRHLTGTFGGCSLVFMKRETLEPSDIGLAQIRLDRPFPVRPKDFFVLCPLNHHAVMGGGRVLEVSDRKYRKAVSHRVVPYLLALQHDDAQTIVRFYLLNNANRLVTRLNNSHFISANAMEEIKKRIHAAISEKGFITLSDSQWILGYGRTQGMPVFEYFDEIGFTRCQGNIRILREKNSDALKNAM